MIPEHIKSNIETHFNEQITNVQSQSGGDINQASILTFDSGNDYFLKWNQNAPPPMFETEANGLQILKSANTELLIPDVILFGIDFLLLDVIRSAPKKDSSDFGFGIELAKLHQCTSTKFGLDHDNFIGKLPQSNSTHRTWADFFISERIEPQLKLGVDSGKFPPEIITKIKTLHSVVRNLFPLEKPSLLHGDLWSGNYMFSSNGKASIYDPAVYYGHREMDIAMTKLFGGFSSAFYKGYQSEYPLADGFEKRIELCNFYPILVHANLFGGGYVNQAIGTLNHFC